MPASGSPEDAYPGVREQLLCGGPVVVTGAAGFIGSHLVQALARWKVPFLGIDRRWGDGADTAQAPPWGAGGDLATVDLEPLLRGAGVVFHLAARPGVRPSWDAFPDYLRDNVLVTQRLLETCVRLGVPRVVMASSSSVYGDGDGTPMDEERTPCPASPYAVTKLAAERLGMAYARRAGGALRVVALRYFTVYGPRQRPDMLIARALRSAREGELLRVHGDGSARRDFTFVGDVVGATLSAAARSVPSGTYNVGTGRNTSINELLALVADVTGRFPRVEYAHPYPGDATVTLADPARTADVLGCRPATVLYDGLVAQERFLTARGAWPAASSRQAG
ncbi:NAD-dependent epimerase/dehydratase family protein [Streptomyces sp. NPDC053048]|uniref:NAD-dependent epimerase/dehydratase family protein n=1 Tax=Streptomyces sp. NPDC053048 TaxID=3365694 RepID=UPI0037CCF3CD